MQATPQISVIVIVYRMARQAMNTLYSLSCRHQKNTREEDYEIIVVENKSDQCLDPDAIAKLGRNFHYFCREETGVSPVPAINFGASQARAPTLCLMIDGARMVTPRIIEYALMCRRASPNALIAVPGYNLGPDEQQFHRDTQYDENTEMLLLEHVQWKQNGYRLFDIANLSGANPKGPLQLFWECNCLFISRQVFDGIGGADERFNLPGGGSINLHLFRMLGMHPLTERYFVLAGEGSFHQFHGGVTTSQSDNRNDLLEQFRLQLEAIWPGGFGGALKREAVMLGAITSHAQRFMHESSIKALERFGKLQQKQLPYWPDDTPFHNYTNFPL